MNQWARWRKKTEMWDFTLAQMRIIFLEAAARLHLEKFRPVLYMGRHSGASLDRLENNISLQEVQRRGRWAAESSVQRYEKRALIQEVYLVIPAYARRLAHRRDQDLIPMLQRMCDAQCSARAGVPHSGLSSSSCSRAPRTSLVRSGVVV